MEPTLTTPLSPQTAPAAPSAEYTSYHHKKALVARVVAIIVILLAAGGLLLWKHFHDASNDPQKVLTSLAESSQPVQKSSDERYKDLKALEPRQQSGQVARPAIAPAARMQMLTNLDQ